MAGEIVITEKERQTNTEQRLLRASPLKGGRVVKMNKEKKNVLTISNNNSRANED